MIVYNPLYNPLYNRCKTVFAQLATLSDQDRFTTYNLARVPLPGNLESS
jgi:hypothetical protein